MTVATLLMTPIGALALVLLLMLLEQRRSARNERALRSAGAFEPPADVYAMMAVTYPLAFVAMAAEGWTRGGAGAAVWGGVAIFALGKALKYWAISALGSRWTFRVLVPPASNLVQTGPYRWLRHPNYIGVILELIGFAAIVGAPVTGILSVVGFATLIRQRIRVEEAALLNEAVNYTGPDYERSRRR